MGSIALKVEALEGLVEDYRSALGQLHATLASPGNRDCIRRGECLDVLFDEIDKSIEAGRRLDQRYDRLLGDQAR